MGKYQVKIPRKYLNHKAQPSWDTKRSRGTNNDKRNPTYETTNTQTKKNCNRATPLERSVEKLFEGLKPILLTENLYLNSDASLNYISSLSHQRNITVKQTITNTMMKQSKGLNDNLKPEQKKTTNMTMMGLTISIHFLAPTFWNRLGRELSFSLRTSSASCIYRGKQSYQPCLG